MTPEQCRELAEYHAFMAEQFAIEHRNEDGLLAAAWLLLSEAERAKARYWREKAGDT